MANNETLNEKIARLNKWAEKLKDEAFVKSLYSGSTTVLEDLIMKYGAENIFCVSQSYHGLYQDDYCDFTYYNNVTGELSDDKWSTAWAAPSFGRFEDGVTMKEALDNGLLNKALVLEKRRPIQKALLDGNLKTNYYKIEPEVAVAAHLRVEVNTGRKWKGTGFLVSTYETRYRYATPMFRTRDADWGVSATLHARIWDPVANTIETVNYSRCEFPALDAMREAYVEACKAYYDSLTEDDVKGIWLSLPEELSWKRFVLENYSMTLPNNPTWKDIEAEKKAEKEAEFKAKKIEELTAWAKACTDVAEEEIPEFVERVYKKRYGTRD
jgi:hypothetical protein